MTSCAATGNKALAPTTRGATSSRHSSRTALSLPAFWQPRITKTSSRCAPGWPRTFGRCGNCSSGTCILLPRSPLSVLSGPSNQLSRRRVHAKNGSGRLRVYVRLWAREQRSEASALQAIMLSQFAFWFRAVYFRVGSSLLHRLL